MKTHTLEAGQFIEVINPRKKWNSEWNDVSCGNTNEMKMWPSQSYRNLSNCDGNFFFRVQSLCPLNRGAAEDRFHCIWINTFLPISHRGINFVFGCSTRLLTVRGTFRQSGTFLRVNITHTQILIVPNILVLKHKVILFQNLFFFYFCSPCLDIDRHFLLCGASVCTHEICIQYINFKK